MQLGPAFDDLWLITMQLQNPYIFYENPVPSNFRTLIHYGRPECSNENRKKATLCFLWLVICQQIDQSESLLIFILGACQMSDEVASMKIVELEIYFRCSPKNNSLETTYSSTILSHTKENEQNLMFIIDLGPFPNVVYCLLLKSVKTIYMFLEYVTVLNVFPPPLRKQLYQYRLPLDLDKSFILPVCYRVR